MINLIMGILLASGFMYLMSLKNKRGINLSFVNWMSIIFAFGYAIFVFELVLAFVEEGTFKGAAVMGAVFGFIAVVWAVLIYRFIFVKKMN